jgi:HNH endonuclease
LSSHPLLINVDRRRAFELLRSDPAGSIRTWSEKLEWHPGRVRRFINSLERSGLAIVTRTPYGTRVQMLPEVELPNVVSGTSRPPRKERNRDILSPKVRFAILARDKFTCRYCGASGEGVKLQVDRVVAVARGGSDDPENLVTACFDCNSGKSDTDLSDPIAEPTQITDAQPAQMAGTPRHTLDTQPDSLGSTAGSKSLGLGAGLDEKEPVDNYSAACIETMNEQLTSIFGAHYRRVKYDNKRSNLACDHWKAAGVELAFAIDEIRKACMRFHPEKHGRGRLPGTLGYFERGVLEAHATRSQTQLPLPPVVQRGGASQEPRGGKPRPVGDFMSAYLDAGGKERRQ